MAVGAGASSYHWKIDDQAEQEALFALVDMLPDDPFIGLTDVGGLNQLEGHEWVADGSKLSFGAVAGEPPWQANQPSSILEYWTIIIKGTHEWNDVDGTGRPFICEAVPAG